MTGPHNPSDGGSNPPRPLASGQADALGLVRAEVRECARATHGRAPVVPPDAVSVAAADVPKPDRRVMRVKTPRDAAGRAVVLGIHPGADRDSPAPAAPADVLHVRASVGTGKDDLLWPDLRTVEA